VQGRPGEGASERRSEGEVSEVSEESEVSEDRERRGRRGVRRGEGEDGGEGEEVEECPKSKMTSSRNVGKWELIWRSVVQTGGDSHVTFSSVCGWVVSKGGLGGRGGVAHWRVEGGGRCALW
jgi:hypothetical protein